MPAPAELSSLIDTFWEARDSLTGESRRACQDAVDAVLTGLDTGTYRIAEKHADGWVTQSWLKKAVLLSFRLTPAAPVAGGPAGSHWFDKVGLKTEAWGAPEFAAAGFRLVPGAIVRRGAHIAPGAVLMPCFVNIGAHVGAGTMVDTWATIGSCAQIGAHCHISGGAGIGGVLEPLQANPVIIEDDCFIGARAEIAEGVIVGQGAVIAMGVFLGASTKIVDRATGRVTYGYIPPYSVVVPGTLPAAAPAASALADGTPGPALACAVIVKQVDARTRAKTALNDLLRD